MDVSCLIPRRLIEVHIKELQLAPRVSEHEIEKCFFEFKHKSKIMKGEVEVTPTIREDSKVILFDKKFKIHSNNPLTDRALIVFYCNEHKKWKQIKSNDDIIGQNNNNNGDTKLDYQINNNAPITGMKEMNRNNGNNDVNGIEEDENKDKIATLFLNFKDIVDENEVWDSKEGKWNEKTLDCIESEFIISPQSSKVLIAMKLLEITIDERDHHINSIIHESAIKFPQKFKPIRIKKNEQSNNITTFMNQSFEKESSISPKLPEDENDVSIRNTTHIILENHDYSTSTKPINGHSNKLLMSNHLIASNRKYESEPEDKPDDRYKKDHKNPVIIDRSIRIGYLEDDDEEENEAASAWKRALLNTVEVNELKILNLMNISIKSIPLRILNFFFLEKIDLSFNLVTHIPSNFRVLNHLKELTLSNNLLTEISDEILQIKTLTKLYVDRNKISVIPKNIENLTNLQTLNLGFNQINSIPANISSLTSLTSLSVHDNLLSGIAKEIKFLKKIMYLNFKNNQITEFPNEICKLSKLVDLNLSNNRIMYIPTSIKELQFLDTFNLANNLIRYIPQNIISLQKLKYLNLSNNQLVQLLPNIYLLSSIQIIDVSQNPLLEDFIPKDILQGVKTKELLLFLKSNKSKRTKQIRKSDEDHPHRHHSGYGSSSDRDSFKIELSPTLDDDATHNNNNMLLSILKSSRKHSLKDTIKQRSLNISAGSSSYLDTRSFIELSFSVNKREDSYLADNDNTMITDIDDDDDYDDDDPLFKTIHKSSASSPSSIFNVPSFHISWLDDLSSENDVSIGGAISFGNEDEGDEDTMLGISIDFGLNLPCFSMTNFSNQNGCELSSQCTIIEGGGFIVEITQKSADVKSAHLLYIENYISYYQNHFYQKEHYNFVGKDPKIGPIIISILRNQNNHNKFSFLVYTQFGVNMLQSSLPNLSSKSLKKIHSKIAHDLLLTAAQNDTFSNTVLFPVLSPSFHFELLSLETLLLIKTHRIGVLYQKNGQQTIEEMISNCEEDCLPSYFSFLNFLGEKQTNTRFLANLEVNDPFDVYHTHWKDLDLIFLVATLLEYDSFDLEQTKRRQLIDECMVLLIYQEPGAVLCPSKIASQYSCAFITIQRDNQTSSLTNPNYFIGTAYREDIPSFGPNLKDPPLYSKSRSFRDFLLTKLVNGDRSSCFSPNISNGMRRARKRILSEIISDYLDANESSSLKNMIEFDSLEDGELFYPSGPLTRSPRDKNESHPHFRYSVSPPNKSPRSLQVNSNHQHHHHNQRIITSNSNSLPTSKVALHRNISPSTSSFASASQSCISSSSSSSSSPRDVKKESPRSGDSSPSSSPRDKKESPRSKLLMKVKLNFQNK